MQVAEKLQLNMVNNPPSPPASLIDHEEVPLDQLVGPVEEAFPEEMEVLQEHELEQMPVLEQNLHVWFHAEPHS